MLKLEMVVRAAWSDVGRLPWLTRVGLAVMAIAGGLDIVVHLAALGHANHHFSSEHAVHALGVVGMVLVLAGVIADGARRQLQHRRSADE